MRLRAAAVIVTATTLLFAPLAAPASATGTTTRIVYAADTNGNGSLEIWSRPADGTGSPTRLINNPYTARFPALSPDGTKVAYVMTDTTIQDIDVSRLYVQTIEPSLGAPIRVLNLDVTASVAWSADGTKVVANAIDWNAFAMATYVVNADGTGTPQKVPTTDKIDADEPSFAPSGTQVALDAFDSQGNYAGIDLVTLSTGKRARIAGTFGGSDPVWTPDGQYILYQRELDGCGVGLYRVPAGGGTPVTIREVPNHFLGSAEYSRDGTELYWVDDPWNQCGLSGKSDLWAGNADGTGAHRIALTPDIQEVDSTVAGGTVTPDTTAPAAPVIKGVGTVGATFATVAWTAPGDATDFVVLRKDHDAPAPTSDSDGTPVYHGPAHTATATGLTAGSAYDFYVFAIDSSGNESPVSAPHPVRATASPTLYGIPAVGRATTTSSFPVSWSGTAPKYQVQVGQKTRSSSGAWSLSPTWTTLQAATPATSLIYPGAQGRTYYFRVRGIDQFGNVTAYAGPKTANVPLNEDWSGFGYSTGWSPVSSSSRYLGTYRYSLGAGHSVSTRVDTGRFVVIGDRCAHCGAFKVYVDGVLRKTVDTYAASTQTRQVLYASTVFSSVKSHSIRIVSVGTAGRSRVDIDGLALQR